MSITPDSPRIADPANNRHDPSGADDRLGNTILTSPLSMPPFGVAHTLCLLLGKKAISTLEKKLPVAPTHPEPGTAVMLAPVGSDPGEWEGTHITFRFIPCEPPRKTHRWIVSAKDGAEIGLVKWFSRWRRYAFFPSPNCVFEETCLGDLAQFIKERTVEHKTGI